MPVDIISAPTGGGPPAAPYVSSLGKEEYLSPWVAATRSKDGHWELPQLGCEINGLTADDPKNRRWTPGEYVDGVDNADRDEQGQVREWGGQKLWSGSRPPRGLIAQLPGNMQALLNVPHMPGQPVKELFARMKAIDPRPFEDKHFEEVLRDLVPEWPALVRQARYTEGFGVHTEQEPAEWRGQEDELVPAVYATPRLDTVTICVGVAGHNPSQGPATIEIPGAEFDFLELLYAKDQEGKVIQILPYPSYGFRPVTFHTFSFVPPKGTTTITPYACFKIRGAWRGSTLEWDPAVGSQEMQWFTDMGPELRAQVADRDKLQSASKASIAALRPPKSKKTLPVLWPENSWEGNAAKARAWSSRQQ